jgi:hypothetical protein
MQWRGLMNKLSHTVGQEIPSFNRNQKFTTMLTKACHWAWITSGYRASSGPHINTLHPTFLWSILILPMQLGLHSLNGLFPKCCVHFLLPSVSYMSYPSHSGLLPHYDRFIVVFFRLSRWILGCWLGKGNYCFVPNWIQYKLNTRCTC